MRHVGACALPVAPVLLARRVCEPACPGPLVSTPGLALRLPAAGQRACLVAVALAAIVRPAEEEDLATGGPDTGREA